LITLCRVHHAGCHPHLQKLLSRGGAELEGYPWREL
jgi:hypothetical protein